MHMLTKADWHALEVVDAVACLETEEHQGLEPAEASERLDRYGPNELGVARQNPWYRVLARQFIDVLIGILLLAAIGALAIGEVGDAVTILAIVVLNGLLGFAQEWKAERAIAALQQMLAPHCKVVRGGRESVIEAREVVPGDLILLEIGDRVPADLRLVEAVNLKADESALTGESVSVSKRTRPTARDAPLADRVSMTWMGTVIVNGWASGIVVETGARTQFGRIAELSRGLGDERTPLQRRLGRLGVQLGAFSVIIAVSIAITGFLMGRPAMEMFMTGVSLAVAVVPEGLPAVVTITLALGIRSMAKRRALLRRLSAAESLGAATVICTDKTGTLTENEMTVSRVWLPSGDVELTGTGYDPMGHFEVDGARLAYAERRDLLELLRAGLICNHARVTKEGDTWKPFGEPTEAALVVAAYKAWLDPRRLPERLTEFSFNSARKRMTVVAKEQDRRVAHIKGAPEVLAERCTWIRDGDDRRPMTAPDRERFLTKCAEMAEGGLRTLALAQRVIPDDAQLVEEVVEVELTLLGAVGMLDPPRPDVPGAIRIAREAGIRVLMITGDAAATALAVARQVGIPAETAVVGSELEKADDRALQGAIDQGAVFARTTPEHKLRIVSLLQGRGHVVGMTGDGVNDAPALKKAEIGISMGVRGTDVAKEASDIVLTDDNFASIIGAVEEGRRQYDNIRKFVRYLLSSNTGEVLAIFVNVVLGGPLILLPVQILWMNLVTDGMTAVALGAEPAERGVMRRRPRAPTESILDWRGIALVLALGSYIAIAALWLFHTYLRSENPQDVLVAQTMAFTGIIVLEKVNVFNFRSLGDPLSAVGLFTNPWVLVAWVLTVGLQVCVVYVPFMQQAFHTVPLGWSEWGIILLFAAPIFVVPEGVKWIRSRRAEPLPQLEEVKI